MIFFVNFYQYDTFDIWFGNLILNPNIFHNFYKVLYICIDI
jgi:hypothetical protein